MRRWFRVTRAWGLVAASLAAVATTAAEPPPARTSLNVPRPRVIGTHQIDRYAAIERLRATLKEHPRALADWIILGELAHEVAVDSPPTQSAQYYTLAREAYEQALALAPDKPGLKAAVQFARDYEKGADRFAAIRDRATQTYLDARRRDLAATGYVPAVRVYPNFFAPAPAPVAPATVAPAPAAAAVVVPADDAPAVSPAPTNTASTDTANFGTRQIYSSSPYAIYQPYALPQGAPYTYRQYSSAYYPPALGTGEGPVPVTLQRYATQERVDEGRPAVNPAYTTPR